MEQARLFGASADDLAHLRKTLHQHAAAPVCEVLPECWFAVMVFNSMSTQWHWAAGGMPAQRKGLRYSALPLVMRSLHLCPHRCQLSDLLPQLQVMEDAAMAITNAQR